MNEGVLFIVFIIDSKYKQHDGKVFRNLSDAREFVAEFSQDPTVDKFIIGSFTLNNSSEMYIHYIESHGFKSDKKEISQLNLFTK